MMQTAPPLMVFVALNSSVCSSVTLSLSCGITMCIAAMAFMLLSP